LKYTLPILLSLFFSWSTLAANPTDKTSKAKRESKSDLGKKSSYEKESDESFYTMEKKVDEVEIPASENKTKSDDPDSSYYSVNKFNYLFYYLYKVKYQGVMDHEEIDLEL